MISITLTIYNHKITLLKISYRIYTLTTTSTTGTTTSKTTTTTNTTTNTLPFKKSMPNTTRKWWSLKNRPSLRLVRLKVVRFQYFSASNNRLNISKMKMRLSASVLRKVSLNLLMINNKIYLMIAVCEPFNYLFSYLTNLTLLNIKTT